MTVDLLAARARASLANAYAPYSRFRVGAAVESVDGAVFSGCNVENASYGLTICAERSAVAQAVASGHRRFRRIVIVADADRAVAPCGACCQVMAEFAADTQVVSFGRTEEKRWQLTELLPHAFDLNKAVKRRNVKQT